MTRRPKLNAKEEKALAALRTLVKKNPDEIPSREDLANALGVSRATAYKLWEFLKAKGAIAEKLEICA